MDGDCPQMAVLMDRDKMKSLGLQCIQDLCKAKFSHLKWRFIKFAAGCSMIQSPNDVSPCHSQTKAQTTVKADFRQKDWEANPEEIDAHMKLFEKTVMRDGVGKGVNKQRERAIMGYIMNSRKIISRAFNAVNCCKGWQLAGLCPLDPEIILSKWNGWSTLDPVDAKAILDAIPELAEIIRLHGRVDDAELNARFPFLPPPLHEHLAAMSWVRDRAVVFSCEGYGSARAAAEPELTAAKASQKARTAAVRARAVELIVYANHCDLLPKTVAVEQCNLRGIQFKAIDKKTVLLDKWKVFDKNNERITALQATKRPRSASPHPPAAAAADSPAARASRLSPRRADDIANAAASPTRAQSVLPAARVSYWGPDGTYHSFLNLRSPSPGGRVRS
jgi:hypothetical protein